MATVTCLCEKCGSIFYSSNELYSPPSRNLFKFSRKTEVPRTWEEWLLHISSNCENCRLKNIPSSCINDYDKLKAR